MPDIHSKDTFNAGYLLRGYILMPDVHSEDTFNAGYLLREYIFKALPAFKSQIS